MSKFDPLNEAAAVIGLLVEIQKELSSNTLNPEVTAKRAIGILSPEIVAILIAAKDSQAIIDQYHPLFTLALDEKSMAYFQHPNVVAWLDLILENIKSLNNET